MSLLTLGINSAMVLDCGYTESLVLPVSLNNAETKFSATRLSWQDDSFKVFKKVIGTDQPVWFFTIGCHDLENLLTSDM